MIIKKYILKILYNLNLKIFLKDNILMESNPDFADNTKYVFEELIRRNYNDKYNIIWFVDNKEKFKNMNIKNVKFLQRDSKLKNRLIFIYYNLFSKFIVDCNKYIKKRNKDQFRIHLTHGTPLKLTTNYTRGIGETDYIIQISDFFTDINCKLFNVDKRKVISTGFPRNDVLFKENEDSIEAFPEISRKKTVLWLPTYRKHKDDIEKKQIEFKYGVPSINSEEQIKELNELLNKNDILLLIKLHPAEDDSKINNLNMTNIKLIKDDIFEKNGKSLYNLLINIDALITDYSSVYYDFLITKKPIGLAIEDIKEYRKKVELLFDNFEDNVPGEYIYDFDGLKKFIIHLSNDEDPSYEDRINKIKIYNKYMDSNSSKRVVDILEKRIKEEINEKRD